MLRFLIASLTVASVCCAVYCTQGFRSPSAVAAPALPEAKCCKDGKCEKCSPQKAKQCTQCGTDNCTCTKEPASPNGLPKVIHPKDNPSSKAKIKLGKQLFFDKRLSVDNTVSCATCHDPAKGWSNGEAVATGVNGLKGGRNSPTVLNTAFQTTQFWDGRNATLEEQALGPIQNPIEMKMTLPLVIDKIKKIDGYKKQFQNVFATEVNAEGIAKAIACYERTVLSGDAPYDRFVAGDVKAMSESATRGWKLFFGKANCGACHSGPNFSNNDFHNLGVGMEKKEFDVGRFEVTKKESDKGAFKTPTLRDIARTAPYMHDGSVKTLTEVVEHYNQGGIENKWLDKEIFALDLSEEEIKDIVAFMKEGLASQSYPDHKSPKLPE